MTSHLHIAIAEARANDFLRAAATAASVPRRTRSRRSRRARRQLRAALVTRSQPRSA